MSTHNLYSYNTTPILKVQRTLEKRGGKIVRVSGPRQLLGDRYSLFKKSKNKSELEGRECCHLHNYYQHTLIVHDYGYSKL